MKPKHFHFISALSLVLALPSAADVIYSNLKDIAIPATFAGVYLDIQTGNLNTNVNAPIFGWDINPFFGGSVLWNSPTFQPVRSGTNATDAVVNLEEGTMVSSSSVFSTFTQGPGGQNPGGPGYGSSESHLGNGVGQFVSGNEGYIGFRTSEDHFGWMRVVLTNNTGGALIKEWAYENSGAAIGVGNIKNNGSSVMLDSLAGAFTVSSPIIDAGGETNLVKSASGLATLTGTNNYSGTTTVSGGTLLVNGTNLGIGLVSVEAAATLGGTGSVAGGLNVTGVLAPGDALESFSSGALTMNSGSTFVYQAANNSTNGADLMVVNGSLSLNNVSLDLIGAGLGLNVWDLGNKLTLISYEGAGLTGGFAGYEDDTVYTFGANHWLFNYNDAIAGGNFASEAIGDNFITLTAVPEPGAALLGSLGLLALLSHRRRGADRAA
jgi:autotransporter-associated beta strand protein